MPRPSRMRSCLTFCVLSLFCTIAAEAASVRGSAGASPTSLSKQSIQVQVPTNCSIPYPPVSVTPAFLSCDKPCNVTGNTSYNVRKGDSLVVSFQARPGVVIIGGSQNLEFMNDPVKDMKLMTAAAPGNPITPVTYTGFQFVPKQDYFQSFQGGVLAKLAVFAFDASRPSQNRSDGVLGMYKTASCRTTIELQLTSPPPNITVGADHLYSDAHPQAMGNAQHSRTTAIVVPCVIGGFVCVMILGCLALGLAKKGAGALPK